MIKRYNNRKKKLYLLNNIKIKKMSLFNKKNENYNNNTIDNIINNINFN